VAYTRPLFDNKWNSCYNTCIESINTVMKITEITKSKTELLRETTMAKIMEQHESDTWSEAMTAEELAAENDAIMRGLGVSGE